jgi:hypothetical protein
MTRLTSLLLLAAVAGCGPTPAPPPPPLTVAEWKALPVEQKYTAAALERLKVADPKLDTAEGWEAFQRTVLREAKRKDFPRGKRR